MDIMHSTFMGLLALFSIVLGSQDEVSCSLLLLLSAVVQLLGKILFLVEQARKILGMSDNNMLNRRKT